MANSPFPTVGTNPYWQQAWANAYSAKNPTWAPPPEANAKLPNPIKPVQFDAMGDLSYAAASSAGDTALAHATDERDYQYGRGAQSFGYNAQGGFDPTNPYSQAAILKRSYDNQVRGTDNSYAAAGQLYAGSRINAQNANQFNYGQSSDALKRAASDFYHGQDMNVQGVGDQNMFALAAALGPAFQAFLANQKGS